jgi:hypothetical protein
MGLSPQRPLYRASQQNPETVQRWRGEQFPAIRKQAKAEGATVYFADEAGIRSDYHAAPPGPRSAGPRREMALTGIKRHRGPVARAPTWRGSAS